MIEDTDGPSSQGGEFSIIRRAAGYAFTIRIVNAGIAVLSQVLLARWMGAAEFGTYVYAWTWVLLIGTVADCGFSTAAQRFLPLYAEKRQFRFTNGFLIASRWTPMLTVAALAGIAATIGFLIGDGIPVLLLLVCLLLPAFGVTAAQDGVARAYGWINLALLPPYLVRPILMLLLMLGAVMAGFAADATTALAAAAIATWATAIVQWAVLGRRLARKRTTRRAAYAFPAWLSTAMPILMVNSFFFLLTYVDVLVLERFRPTSEIAVYFAAGKGTAFIAMLYFAVSAAATRKFSGYFATADMDGLRTFYGKTIEWMFWPSLAACAALLIAGKPFLWLFGAEFTAGYTLLPIMVIGVMARVAVGPAEQLLNMAGQIKACTAIYATAFLANLLLCLVLVPRFGTIGAAASTSTAIVLESVLLFIVIRRRLGIHAFIAASSHRVAG